MPTVTKVQFNVTHPTNADDSDMTLKAIREVTFRVPQYAAGFAYFAVWYFMFVFGGYPSASSSSVSFIFLHNHVKISFMSMFARFMYVFSTRYTTGSWNQ